MAAEKQPVKVDPLSTMSVQLRSVAGVTFAGIVAILFFYLVTDLRSQGDRIIEKLQTLLDKQEDRRAKDREYEDNRIRELVKSNTERYTILTEQLKLEIKELTTAVNSLKKGK